jgi:3-oxoadipate enol-lactonase
MKLAAGKVDTQIIGRGPTLVLFHSLLADASSFGRITGALAEHFRVVVPSLPGFLGSEAVSGGIEAVADRMAEAVREVAPDERPLLLGNGYGGFVALSLVIRHPGLVSRLILCDSGAAFSEPGREAFRTMVRLTESGGLESVADIAMRRLFASDFHAANPEMVADRRERFLAVNKTVFTAACEALVALDLRSELKGITIPVFALVGEQDEATPPAMSRELVAMVPGARFALLPGCAHVPQLQSPEKFLAAVGPFLSERIHLLR